MDVTVVSRDGIFTDEINNNGNSRKREVGFLKSEFSYIFFAFNDFINTGLHNQITKKKHKLMQACNDLLSTVSRTH